MIFTALLIPLATQGMQQTEQIKNSTVFSTSLNLFLYYHTKSGKGTCGENHKEHIEQHYQKIINNIPSSLDERLSYVKTFRDFIKKIVEEAGYKKPSHKDLQDYIANKCPLIKQITDSMFKLD